MFPVGYRRTSSDGRRNRFEQKRECKPAPRAIGGIDGGMGDERPSTIVSGVRARPSKRELCAQSSTTAA